MTRRSLVASIALAATVVAAQDSPRLQPDAVAPTTIKGGDADLVRSVRSVGARVAGIVGAARAPSLLALRADEPTRAAESTVRAERWLPARLAAARGRAWQDLGLGSGGAPRDLVAAIASDLPGMTFDAAGAHLLVDAQRVLHDAGHGDPNDDTGASLLLATGVAPDEPVVGHYVAHALLDPPPAGGPTTTDGLLARSALAEGSANLAALAFLFGGVGLESEVLAGAIRPEDALEGRLVPAAMRSAGPEVASFLEFVYLDGFAQAARLARQGGFIRLAQERTRRLTTRDVLHLDRPVEPPVAVLEPSVAAELGLVAVDRDALGEQGIVTMVSLLTGKDNLGMIAGDGWAGDGLWRFEPAAGSTPGEGATIWVTRWKTVDDANDFRYSMERCLQARFPGASVVDDPERGGGVLSRAERVYRIEQSGSEVAFRAITPATDQKMGPVPKKKVPARPPVKPKK